MDLERIKLFNALAENLNYSKTAELMHISQSALSRYIAELEMTLGTRLFERTTRKVELTPDGKVFLAGARKLAADYDNLILQMRRLDEDKEEVHRIGYAGPFAFDIRENAMNTFRAKYPHVKIQAFDLPRENSVAALKKKLVDIIFVLNLEKFEGIENLTDMKLLTGEAEVVVDQDHFLAKHHEVSAMELQNELIITLGNEGNDLRDEILKMATIFGYTPKFSNLPSSIDSLLTSVQGGGGISILSSMLDPYLIHFSKLKTVKIKDYHIQSDLRLVWGVQNKGPFVHHYIEEVVSATKRLGHVC